MTVDFATYCCEKDIKMLMKHYFIHWQSHCFGFDHNHIIFQRVDPLNSGHDDILKAVNYHIIKEEDYDGILKSYKINPVNKQADEYTHGWNHSHYWRHHVVNHLVALRESTADYIVLSDADCHMSDAKGHLTKNTDWIKKGIEILMNDINILIVSPSDGSAETVTQNMSQQLFLCERARLAEINFDLPFEGFKEGGPMQEYYFMLEGRIGRYMEKNNLFRYIMDSRYRYWHEQWH